MGSVSSSKVVQCRNGRNSKRGRPFVHSVPRVGPFVFMPSGAQYWEEGKLCDAAFDGGLLGQLDNGLGRLQVYVQLDN